MQMDNLFLKWKVSCLEILQCFCRPAKEVCALFDAGHSDQKLFKHLTDRESETERNKNKNMQKK